MILETLQFHCRELQGIFACCYMNDSKYFDKIKLIICWYPKSFSA